jgi:hypothetical protein
MGRIGGGEPEPNRELEGGEGEEEEGGSGRRRG